MRVGRRRKPKIDRKRWPSDYVGPVTTWGLEPGPCRIEKRWAGGFVIVMAASGLRYTVAKQWVVPAS